MFLTWKLIGDVFPRCRVSVSRLHCLLTRWSLLCSGQPVAQAGSEGAERRAEPHVRHSLRQEAHHGGQNSARQRGDSDGAAPAGDVRGQRRGPDQGVRQ